MAADQRDFAARRERLALRQQLTSQTGAAHLADNASLRDVDLGNFVALQSNDTLWVSATPLAANETRTSALGAVLAWWARGQDRSAGRDASGASAVPIAAVKIFDGVNPGITARQATYFTTPIEVFDTRDSGKLGAGRAVAAPHEPQRDAHPSHLKFVELFHQVGADVVIEHGVVAAEVMGLEVARVIEEDGVAVLRIGVGVHDREMFRMLHGDVATGEQLRGVVQTVSAQRRTDAPTHPLNLLATERALRQRVLTSPASVGLHTLSLAEPPLPRRNLKDAVPCCAVGVDASGATHVVVFVAGIDLDAVPFAADARDRLARSAQLVVVAERRNIVPLQVRIGELLAQPAKFVSA